jgi:cell division protein FtsB
MPRALRLWALVGGVLVAGFVGAALFGVGGVARHERLKEELSDLEARNQRLEAENRRLAQQVQALRHDERYLEHVIRDELGWVSADEMVVIFPEGEKAE